MKISDIVLGKHYKVGEEILVGIVTQIKLKGSIYYYYY